jgi:hypothetical protein
VAADLEGERRTVRIADVDPRPILDLNDRDTTVADIKTVEASVVDGYPSALVKPHDEVGAGDQRVGNADVCAKVTPDHNVVAWCEGALGSLVPHGERRRGWWTHQDQL